ncbi:hypothetical protein [Streptomyces sp. NPDC013457]|uniref:hypothetical protein n=1 Tax=Streptomyces sp. NPDC013457 TaxID=3364866 RepID=UPI0037021BE5
MTAVDAAPEAEEQPSKLAGGCVLAVGVALAAGAVYAVPELGYTVAGLGAAAGCRRARTWLRGRRKDTADEVDEEQPVDIVAVLQELGEDGDHVLLTRLREAAGVADTKAVRALLDDADVPVRAGVRTPGGNGPGVHQDDIPRESPTPSGGCLCRSDANANANNAPEQDPEKGFRVEAIGQGGALVHDPADAHRHHAIAKS